MALAELIADHRMLPHSEFSGGRFFDFAGHWLQSDLSVLRETLQQGRLVSVFERDKAKPGEILHWLELLHAEDAGSAVVVAQRLEYLLGFLDADGLARWILTGLRRYPREPKRLIAYFRLEDPRAVEALHAEADAEDLQQSMPSLAILLKCLSGRDMTLQARHNATLNAPPLRPVLTSSHLLLPSSYTSLDGVDRYRIYRAAVAHAAAHLLYSTPRRAADALKPMGIAVVSAIEDARIERMLIDQLPGVKRWFSEFLVGEIDSLKLDFASLIARLSRVLNDTGCEDDNYWVNKARTLFEAEVARNGLTDYAAFRSIASILANDLGQMRVRFNPQQYSVPSVYRDDHSYLWDYGDPDTPPPSLQELQFTGVSLETKVTEVAPQESAENPPQPAKRGQLSEYVYPEWDYRLEHSRADWCTVIERHPPPPRLRSSQGNVPQAQLLTLPPLVRSRRLSRARRVRRQWEGEDIDLNAAIDIVVERRLELAPDGRLFTRAGHQERVSSVLILLDLSESANDRVGGSMQSILDIEKQAAVLLATATANLKDRLAVHGFSSNTRHEVNYLRLLDFSQTFDTSTPRVIQAVQAEHSTRMGAALRHAASYFKTETSDQHAIVVITDGEPSDVDVFDVQYLIEDARKAVQEARQSAINCFCIALDSKADAYVKRIFGWLNYRIVDDAKNLPRHLANLYSRLTSV